MKNFLLFCTLLLTTVAFSKPLSITDPRDGTISGRVMDASLNQPLPYVTIVVKSANGDIITGAITQDDGTFEIKKIPEGDVVVNIQFIGYKTVTKNVKIGDGNYNVSLGDVSLEENVAALDEVTVVAEVSTIQQKVDRKVINVGKDLTTAGATASDIMNNIPSVNVDQQTGNISLRGNENVRVMVDGKLSNVPVAQLLKQIPSTSIKSIELITNPSAKYNPEGMSGIINIVLHKNTNLGFNGNFNVGLTKEINARFNGSIDMNYRNGKFNFYGNYGNNTGRSESGGQIDRPNDGSMQIFSNDNNNQAHLYKLGVDFYLNDANTFSFFTNQNIFYGMAFGNTAVIYPEQAVQRQLFNNEIDNQSGQYNFAYKHAFKKEGEKLDVEVDYNDFIQDEDSNFRFVNFDFPPNYLDFVDTERDQTTINVDYVNPLNDKTKLEVGLEARLYDTNVQYSSTGLSFDEVGNIIPTPSTDFDYSRDIYSAYVTFGKTFEKWSYQVGARAETVKDEANALRFFEDDAENIPFENEYFQIYPSAFLTYTPSEKNSYQASFSRRVDRPGLNQVNPIREWSTPLVSSFGNTELLPQYTNSMELNYTRNLEKGSVTAGVFFRLIEDEINRAVFIDRLDLSRVILSYDNFQNTTAYGLELSSNYRPTKWWNFNASFDLYSQTQKGITEIFNSPEGEEPAVEDIVVSEVSVDNVVYNIRMINNFKATKHLSFSIFGLYRGRNEGLQFTREPMYFVNTGIRYSFLENDAATFSFNYNDIFNTMEFAFEGDRPYPTNGAFNWESNTWNIALSYRFGGGKYRALQRKNRDDNEKSGSGGFL